MGCGGDDLMVPLLWVVVDGRYCAVWIVGVCGCILRVVLCVVADFDQASISSVAGRKIDGSRWCVAGVVA